MTAKFTYKEFVDLLVASRFVRKQTSADEILLIFWFLTARFWNGLVVEHLFPVIWTIDTAAFDLWTN